ncbi:hypothetical protein TIFTF001_024964 [Ficus carica]|uniref:Uncharacterized protein n=1 Tax=Ficus carica TaxID=3494 RepID=A0AA88DKG8_FICCA|nr:hypothetical protein TIFTF001_024964 [Ficus carica]
MSAKYPKRVLLIVLLMFAVSVVCTGTAHARKQISQSQAAQGEALGRSRNLRGVVIETNIEFPGLKPVAFETRLP